MAIEFFCPYCSAQIRVVDKSAGKSGKCPRCVRRLTVPRVSTVVPPPVTVPGPELVPALSAPIVAPSLPATAESGPAPEVVFAEAAPAPWAPATAPVAAAPDEPAFPVKASAGTVRRVVKKRRGPLPLWLIPAVGGLALIVGLAWFVVPGLIPNLPQGELVANVVEGPDLPPALVDKSLLTGQADAIKAALAELERQPIPLLSSLMQVQFRGSARGLQVYLSPGAETVFYRVDLAGNPSLQSWLKGQGTAWQVVRDQQVESAAAAFLPVADGVLSGKQSAMELTVFRDSLGLPALVGGLGYQVAARYQNRQYPCVYQQGLDFVWFLLPPGVREFTLEGRKPAVKGVEFPLRLLVRVGETITPPVPQSPKVSASTEAPKSAPEKTAEPMPGEKPPKE